VLLVVSLLLFGLYMPSGIVRKNGMETTMMGNDNLSSVTKSIIQLKDWTQRIGHGHRPVVYRTLKLTSTLLEVCILKELFFLPVFDILSFFLLFST